jgi:hypothetical protein
MINSDVDRYVITRKILLKNWFLGNKIFFSAVYAHENPHHSSYTHTRGNE